LTTVWLGARNSSAAPEGGATTGDAGANAAAPFVVIDPDTVVCGGPLGIAGGWVTGLGRGSSPVERAARGPVAGGSLG
jgi:hypothetical protein